MSGQCLVVGVPADGQWIHRIASPTDRVAIQVQQSLDLRPWQDDSMTAVLPNVEYGAYREVVLYSEQTWNNPTPQQAFVVYVSEDLSPTEFMERMFRGYNRPCRNCGCPDCRYGDGR